jgi:hypothetical protein
LSYDLYLVRVPPGADPTDAAREFIESQEEVDDTALRVDSSGTDVRTLAPQLLALNPALEPFKPDFAEIARASGTTEAEARASFRHVEINTPESAGTGIQITLYECHASVTVPYWHQGSAATAVWAEIWLYLDALERAGGLRTFDTQLDRVLDLATDLPAVVDSYGGGATACASLAAQINATPRRPWWKFW